LVFFTGYDVSLLYSLENIPADFEENAKKAALLKRNCFASVFEKYRCGRDRMVVGFTTTYAISAYHH
jgi:hypothetical protein